MTLRAPTSPPIRVLAWQKQPAMIEHDYTFVADVMRLWDLGWNTADIALNLFQPESVVERALHLGRERRRRERNDC